MSSATKAVAASSGYP